MNVTGSATIAFIDLAAQQRRLRPRIDAAIARVLDHGQYILGPEVQILEERLAAFSGARFVSSCASGTDALLMVLMAKGIGPGDAVFIPAFTFVATAEVVALLGATPVFVDVDPEHFLIDIASLEAAVRAAWLRGLRPQAVIPVDLFGQPADYQAIAGLARDNGLFVLADAAQSFGGARGGKRVGALAPATAISFFPAKPLGCYGEGGAVFTDDPELADSLRSLRVHGQGQDRYDHVRVGINGRLDTVQAAVLIEKLSIFEEELEARERVAQRYSEGLRGIVRTPAVAANARSAWAQYTLRLGRRDAIAAALTRRNMPTAVHYPRPLHQQAAYRGCPIPAAGLPVSERLSSEVLSLPMHPYLHPETQNRIIEAVGEAIAATGADA